jgi:hypothetical protein
MRHKTAVGDPNLVRRFVRALPLACAVSLAATPAWPAAFRTFVASYGNDTNPCTVTQPCRSFGVAIGQTFANGEVIVLDSGGYGGVTINKSVSLIAAPGVYAGVSVFQNQPGVYVDAGANDRIVLRGLSVNGQGGLDGIVVGTSGEVHIESCTVSNMNGIGIIATLGSHVRIAGSTLRSNGLDGIFFAGNHTIVVDDTQSVRNGRNGMWFSNAANGTIRRSRFTDNAYDGLVAWIDAGTGFLTVQDSEFSGNGNIGVKLWAIPGVGSPFLGASLDRVSSARNNESGVEVVALGAGNVNATLSNSHVVWNAGFGVTGSYDGVALVTVSGSTVNHNLIAGVNAEGGAGVQVGLHDNSIALNGGNDIRQAGAATVRVFGTNATTGNASDVSGTLTSVSRQ